MENMLDSELENLVNECLNASEDRGVVLCEDGPASLRGRFHMRARPIEISVRLYDGKASLPGHFVIVEAYFYAPCHSESFRALLCHALESRLSAAGNPALIAPCERDGFIRLFSSRKLDAAVDPEEWESGKSSSAITSSMAEIIRALRIVLPYFEAVHSDRHSARSILETMLAAEEADLDLSLHETLIATLIYEARGKSAQNETD